MQQGLRYHLMPEHESAGFSCSSGLGEGNLNYVAANIIKKCIIYLYTLNHHWISVVWDWGRLLDSVMQNVGYILILNEAQEWSGFQKAEGIWVSKYLLNKWLGYGSKRVKQYGKLEFTTVPVILPVIVFFIYLLAKLSSLCIWILHKEKLVRCIDVMFILSLYPMTVTCISEVIFNANFWRHQTEQWYACFILFT